MALKPKIFIVLQRIMEYLEPLLLEGMNVSYILLFF